RKARFRARISLQAHCLSAEGTSREAKSWRSGRRIASYPGFHATKARVLKSRSLSMLLPCIVRPGEIGGTGKGWQERSSSQNRLGGCKENKKYFRSLETASCKYSKG